MNPDENQANAKLSKEYKEALFESKKKILIRRLKRLLKIHLLAKKRKQICRKCVSLSLKWKSF